MEPEITCWTVDSRKENSNRRSCTRTKAHPSSSSHLSRRNIDTCHRNSWRHSKHAHWSHWRRTTARWRSSAPSRRINSRSTSPTNNNQNRWKHGATTKDTKEGKTKGESANCHRIEETKIGHRTHPFQQAEYNRLKTWSYWCVSSQLVMLKLL